MGQAKSLFATEDSLEKSNEGTMATETASSFNSFATYLLSAPHITEMIVSYFDVTDVVSCLRTSTLVRRVIQVAVWGRPKLERLLQSEAMRSVCTNGRWNTIELSIPERNFARPLLDGDGRPLLWLAGNWLLYSIRDCREARDSWETVYVRNFLTGEEMRLNAYSCYLYKKDERLLTYILHQREGVTRLVLPEAFASDFALPRIEKVYSYMNDEIDFYANVPHSLCCSMKNIT